MKGDHPLLEKASADEPSRAVLTLSMIVRESTPIPFGPDGVGIGEHIERTIQDARSAGHLVKRVAFDLPPQYWDE